MLSLLKNLSVETRLGLELLVDAPPFVGDFNPFVRFAGTVSESLIGCCGNFC